MKLLRMLVVTALALCATLGFAADADPPSVVARLNHISGPVSFAPAESNEDWTAAALNRPVTTGDRLWTDTDGRAELHVGSLAIRMGARTSMDVLNLDDNTLQLRLAQGSVNLRVRRLSSDKVLEIATPSGAVVVKQPGTYRVTVDPSGSATMVAVRGGGQAEVFTGNSSFAVRDNQEAEVSGSRQGLYAAPAPDEFDRWAAGRDQREDRVVSTRYVPEEMTGYEDLDHHGAWSSLPEYGAVWVPTTVPSGWAPYRDGHWAWISPWGWTWVDNAPWGFAPFHYGRWVWLGNHWGWAPGRRIAQPVYSPAMVAFIGGSNFSVSLGFGGGPAVGWVPLGWREPYRPWYRASHRHLRDVNVTHVTNVTNITNNVNIRHVNRSAPAGVTVVSRENFIAARQVRQASLNVPARQLAEAPVTQGAPVATPARTSFTESRRGSRPSAEVTSREAVAVNAPPARARDAVREGREDRRSARLAGNEEAPRVRVINRQERVNLPVGEAQRATAPAAPSATEAPRPSAVAPSAVEAQRPQPQSRPEQSRAAERAQERAPTQAQPAPRPDPANRGERTQQQTVPQAQPGQQVERRAPAPSPEISRRPTFDRDLRPSTPDRGAAPAAQGARTQERAERRDARERATRERRDTPQQEPRSQAPAPPPAVSGRPTFDREMRASTASGIELRREQRQTERRERPEPASGQGNGAPQTQAAPQPENRTIARPAQDVRGSQQVEQQRQSQAREQQAREQQAREREAQQRQETQQRAQQQRAQQQAQEQQQVREQQARQRQLQQREESQQRAQAQRAQQEQQRQQQQAQAQQAREQQARQQEQQRAQQQRAQQEQQRQQQAQVQQAREQQARQQEQQRAQQQRAQQQQREAQAAAAVRAAPQRPQQSNEKGGRDRPRPDRPERS